MELECFLRMRLKKIFEKDTQKSKHSTIKIHNRLKLNKDAKTNSKNVEKCDFPKVKTIKILTSNRRAK
jgi:hypothetical protein